MSAQIHTPNADSFIRTVALLNAGKLIGLPTETVYGLAANAKDASALANIFKTKGRPADHPLIVHVASIELAKGWALEWSEAAQKLADAFWPGPMTLIVKRAPHVLDAVTGGQDTVGLRVPAHPVAFELLTLFGGGVAAPSANKFGHVSPTTAEHVASEFSDTDLFILNGGACEVGVESTIVDVSGERSEAVRILRPGRVRIEDIERVLGVKIADSATHQKHTPRVSGSLESHYAPSKPAYMMDAETLRAEIKTIESNGQRVGALLCGAHKHIDVNAYEHDLYAKLRALDERADVDVILIESPPETEAWDAVNDRLRRATFNFKK